MSAPQHHNHLAISSRVGLGLRAHGKRKEGFDTLLRVSSESTTDWAPLPFVSGVRLLWYSKGTFDGNVPLNKAGAFSSCVWCTRPSFYSAQK
jgi:hypothetical protein